MQEQQIPYDLSSHPIQVLIISNTHDTGRPLPFLPYRSKNASRLEGILPKNAVTTICCSDATSDDMQSITKQFLSKVEDVAKGGNPVVTLFYFSGYGTRLDDDADQAVLCGTDHNEKNFFRARPYRLLFDYIHPVSRFPGVHMLLMDCAGIETGVHFSFMMPRLEARFHALYTTDDQMGSHKTGTSPLTETWCSLVRAKPSSIEDLSKAVRISMVSQAPYLNAHECSTLYNHFTFPGL